VDRADGHEMAGGFDMAVAANLRHDELLDIIAALPSEFQQVFNMSVIDQLSHAEIAQMLNIDIVTSRTRLARARKRVQTELHARCLEILCV
jgi:RNA polymerase sigma factor (sigma-70 family)